MQEEYNKNEKEVIIKDDTEGNVSGGKEGIENENVGGGRFCYGAGNAKRLRLGGKGRRSER